MDSFFGGMMLVKVVSRNRLILGDRLSSRLPRLVLVGCLLGPVVVVLLLLLLAGEGYGMASRIHDIAVVGPVLTGAGRAIIVTYFPPFLRAGSVSPVFALFWLYPVFGALYLARRQWLSGGIILLVPLVCSWVFSAILLGG